MDRLNRAAFYIWSFGICYRSHKSTKQCGACHSCWRWLSTRKHTKGIMAKQKRLSPKYQVWVDARKRHKLSHAHIQMARELGMNPKKFGNLDNHRQEPWKAPLPIFIENLYFKRFGKERPENVRSIEQIVKDKKNQNKLNENSGS